MDEHLVIAMGKALALVGTFMDRAGVVGMKDFSGMLALLGEADRDERPIESGYLCVWAQIVGDSAAASDNWGRGH